MGRAQIKQNYPNPIGRGKLYDKAINTKLEKRIQQIAKAEVDKDKIQKILIESIFGTFHLPAITSPDVAGDGSKYTEATHILERYVTQDGDIANTTNGSVIAGFKRQCFYFPKIRTMGALGALNATKEFTNLYGMNDNIVYSIGGTQIGYSRGDTDEIRYKGFKLSGELIPNPLNKEDEIEVIIAVFKIDPNKTFKQRDIQYLLASQNQNAIMPKRLINDILGSDIAGQDQSPQTEDIKSRILYKKWTLRPRQEMYLTVDKPNLEYNKKIINFSYYVNCDQTIKYCRSGLQTSGVGQRPVTSALNLNQATGAEVIEFENLKYCFMCKSNVLTANQATKAPKMKMLITHYWTDIN